MSHYANWEELPSDILQCIFKHTLPSSAPHWVNSRHNFKAFQLVCKGWSKTAQEAIYENVHLGEQADSFLNTLEKEATHVGALVKKVSFLPSFGRNKNQNVDKIIESVIQWCPNIQDLCTYRNTQNRLIWPYLVSDKSQIVGLKTLFTYDWIKKGVRLYSTVALKYRNTLTRLDLTNGNADYNHHPQGLAYQQLITQLDRFVSLEQLFLTICVSFDFDDLDRLLDNCPSTVNEISINSLKILEYSDLSTQNNMKPNTSIKKLRVERAQLSASILHYLSIKLKALEELTLEYLGCYETEKWWNQFTNFCLPLKEYKVQLKLTNVNYPYKIQRCADLAVKTAPSKCNKGGRKLEISNLDKFRSGFIDYNLSMAKTLNSYTLEVDPFCFYNHLSVEDLLKPLSLFSPDLINIIMPIIPRSYYQAFVTTSGDKSARKFLSAGDFKDIFIQKQIMSPFSRDWIALNDLIPLLSQVKPVGMSLYNMVLFHEEIPISSRCVSGMSELYFTDSILQQSILPEISLIAPEIKHFEINTCCILVDEPYNLKIFLPSTKIHTLVLVIDTFIIAVEYIADYSNVNHEDCSLENLDLLGAVSSEGRYTLKIETDAKTYIIQRQGNKTINSKSQDPITGTKDDFLIWIKCQELNQFLISNQWSEEYEQLDI